MAIEVLFVTDVSTYSGSKKLPVLVIIILLSVSFIPGCITNDDDDENHQKPYEGKKILFINSYHEGYEWSDGISAAINESFEDTGVELRFFYMDTKRNPEEDFKNQSAHDAKAVLDFFDPDVVITSDDNAFKYLIMPYYRNATLPFAFCGINWDISAYEGAPYTNTAGMIEVVPIVELVDCLKNYSSGTRIGYLSIDSLTVY